MKWSVCGKAFRTKAKVNEHVVTHYTHTHKIKSMLVILLCHFLRNKHQNRRPCTLGILQSKKEITVVFSTFRWWRVQTNPHKKIMLMHLLLHSAVPADGTRHSAYSSKDYGYCWSSFFVQKPQLQAVWCWWTTVWKEKVDSLFRGCDCHYFLCCNVRIRSGKCDEILCVQIN